MPEYVRSLSFNLRTETRSASATTKAPAVTQTSHEDGPIFSGTPEYMPMPRGLIVGASAAGSPVGKRKRTEASAARRKR